MRRRLSSCLCALLVLPILTLFVAYRISPGGVRDLLISVHMRLVDSSVSDFLDAAGVLTVSRQDRAALMDLARRFDLLATANGLLYNAAGGVVLGFVRHGGLVPWDDDYDVLLPRAQKALLVSLFAGNKDTHGLRLVKNGDYNYKATLSQSGPNRRALWPYVDIFLYEDRGDYIVLPNFRLWYFEKATVHPLTRVELSPGVVVNFPRCPWRYAARAYTDVDRCCTGKWNHRLESPGPMPRCVRCQLIRDHFAFANFEPLNATAVRMETRRGAEVRVAVHRVSTCGVDLRRRW